jgi:hypothetical protein
VWVMLEVRGDQDAVPRSLRHAGATSETVDTTKAQRAAPLEGATPTKAPEAAEADSRTTVGPTARVENPRPRHHHRRRHELTVAGGHVRLRTTRGAVRTPARMLAVKSPIPRGLRHLQLRGPTRDVDQQTLDHHGGLDRQNEYGVPVPSAPVSFRGTLPSTRA